MSLIFAVRNFCGQKFSRSFNFAIFAKICEREIYIFLLPKYRYCYLNFSSTSAKEPQRVISLRFSEIESMLSEIDTIFLLVILSFLHI